MREIKFRVWIDSEQRYVDGLTRYLFGSDDDEKCTLCMPQDFIAIFEQYVGLKDKNGKEIYEGDIIDFYGEKYPVIYRAGGFWAEYGKTQKDHLFLYAIDSEVIGNIHENPELIEKEQE